MDKNKIIKLLELLNDQEFKKEVDSCFSSQDIEKHRTLNKVLELDEKIIDNILETTDLKKKAYKFYLYVYNVRFRDENKEKLVKAIDQDNFPLFLLPYVKKLSCNIHNYDVDKQIEIFNKASKEEEFQKEIFKVVKNKNLDFSKIKDILESLSEAVLDKSVKEATLILANQKFAERYDITKIIAILAETVDEINLEMASDFLKEKNIENFEYLDYVLNYLTKSSFANSIVIFDVFKDSNVRNAWLSRDIAESIANANSFEVAKYTGKVALNRKLQKEANYRDLVEIISMAREKEMAGNGKILLDDLIKNNLLKEVDVKKLLKGVVFAKDEEISYVALSAALNQTLRKNRNYEEIVFSLGYRNSDLELAKNGLDIALNSNMIERNDLLLIVNCVSTDGVKEKKLKAFEIAKNKNLQKKRHFSDILSAVSHSFTKEQADLAYRYAMDENNKDLEDLDVITSFIGKAKTLLQSKIIYDLGYNKDVISLKEEGLEIMKEIFDANSQEEIDYILNTKYDINNLGSFTRLNKIFLKDHNTIINFLKTLEEDNINKDTKVRKMRK